MQKEERRKSQILKVLPKSIVPKMESFDFTYLQEIRMRAEKPVVLLYKGREVWLSPISQSELREALEYISNYSLYAYEQELRQGFLTIEGGHRVGMAGKIISDGGKVTNLIYISSVNIRVSHEIEGCADCLFPWIVSEGELLHTLLISPLAAAAKPLCCAM